MIWFKHDTDASNDAKIKKLILKHGAVGYAVYFHCLELIAGNISEKNITFELEHDSEIIADNLKIKGTSEKSGRAIVEEIMLCIIQLGLFEESEGHIFCFKLLKRLDSSMTSNGKLRNLLSDAKKRHDSVMISHDDVMSRPDKVMQEETRLDKTRREEKREEGSAKASPRAQFKKPTQEEVQSYLNTLGCTCFTGKYFCDRNDSVGWVVGKNKTPMKDWKAAVRTWIGNDKKRTADSHTLTTSEFMALSPADQERVRRERHAS